MGFEFGKTENPKGQKNNEKSFLDIKNKNLVLFLAGLVSFSGCDANKKKEETTNNLGRVESGLSKDALERLSGVSAICKNNLDDTKPCTEIVQDMEKCIKGGVNPIDCGNMAKDEIDIARKTTGNREELSPEMQNLIKNTKR